MGFARITHIDPPTGRGPGGSRPPPPCRPSPGSRASFAEPWAFAMNSPDCGQFASWSDGRASAPKNDSPWGLITFVVLDCTRRIFRWEPKLYSTGASRTRSNEYEFSRHRAKLGQDSGSGSGPKSGSEFDGPAENPHQLLHSHRRYGDGRGDARSRVGARGVLGPEFSAL